MYYKVSSKTSTSAQFHQLKSHRSARISAFFRRKNCMNEWSRRHGSAYIRNIPAVESRHLRGSSPSFFFLFAEHVQTHGVIRQSNVQRQNLSSPLLIPPARIRIRIHSVPNLTFADTANRSNVNLLCSRRPLATA